MRRRIGWTLGGAFGLVFVAGVASGTDEFDPAVPPPPPCTDVNQDYDGSDCAADFATSDLDFCFSDAVPANSSYPNKSGNDGQIWVVGDDAGGTDCGTILVKETGYYAIFDSELSESCADQLDETGYLTVENSCNGQGWAVEANVGDRFLVLDADNEGAGCTTDAECGPNKVCREGTNHGNCCVPDEPVYMGTFLLVEGEENVICIRHWCPEWEAEQAMGNDLGWVHDPNEPSNNCVSADSIHFKIAATSVVCKQEGYIQACVGGCVDGDCLPHPCFLADCPEYCVMNSLGQAECVDSNPCAATNCEHGCVFGLCLQRQGARGPDEDGDGYSNLADCDDTNPDVNPAASEDCDNGVDDDCDGFIDCSGDGQTIEVGVGGGGSGSGGSNAADATDSGGCGCEVVGAPAPANGLRWAWLLLGLPLLRRRRRG